MLPGEADGPSIMPERLTASPALLIVLRKQKWIGQVGGEECTEPRGRGGAHLHSGSAIEREGFDLPVLQENLQHVGNEEESFFLQHVLACGASKGGGEEGGGHGERREGGDRESVSDGALVASSAALGFVLRGTFPLKSQRSVEPSRSAELRQFRAA